MTYINDPVKAFSIYTNHSLTEKEFTTIKIFCDAYLTKFVGTYDLFCKINSFVNYNNAAKDNYFAPDSQLLDLELLLNMGGVTNPEHISIFEEIAFELLDSSGSARQRAQTIHAAWITKSRELYAVFERCKLAKCFLILRIKPRSSASSKSSI